MDMLNINLMPFPTLSTGRLKLRQITTEDANEIFFLRSDKTVMKFLDKAPAKSIEEALAFIQKVSDGIANNDGITWAMTLHDKPTLIGTIGFWRIEREHYRAEVGYVLHPGYQGMGLMQEAMTAVLDYGFSIIKFHSIEANVNPDNKASIKLLERNNFIREAYFKENYYFNGKFLDTAIYSLLSRK